ncbi:MAG: ABC transporter permease [Thermofilum sp.]|jgi:peptide/nickel transport system permease protein|uniref:ABC transporter permease n=1 Tax=Thermofilum sp. TaxID=1961369 RepID=UPI002588CBCF|nr:ABC transporter permease [Thermofilum sp.]MCI4407474.1 ABC transporter permease [Thermofilum sp.]
MPLGREYLLKRLFHLVFVVFGVLIITFIITRVLPARPELLWAGPHATIEQIERARKELHLDEPIYVQLGYYLWDFIRGNWGVSWRTKTPVLDGLLSALPATLELIIFAFSIATVLGVLLGIVAALRRNTMVDSVIQIFSVLGASMPVFWLALIMLYVFSNTLGWLPSSNRVDETLVISTGFHPITGFYLIDSLMQGNFPVFIDVLRHMILPALVLSLYPMGLSARMTRAMMIDVLHEPFIRSALAWGIPKKLVVYKYALKNAVAPVIASLGLSFGYTIIGAFMVELIFVWPGIGLYTAMSLLSFDYPAIMGAVIIVALFYSVINLIVDLIHAWIDPRLRL